MNYEDRTDLESPKALLGTETVEALSRAWQSVDDKVAIAFSSAATTAEPAAESLLMAVIRPETDLKGSPPEAWPVGLAAARAGYRLASLMVDPGEQKNMNSREIVERVHRMYVYELYSGIQDETSRLIQSKLMDLITRFGAPRRGDFEVHAGHCFALGLAAAVVECDVAKSS